MNLKRKHIHKLFSKKNRGSLLTEMMVGLVISAMTVLLITVVSFEFEKQKKVTTSVSNTIASTALMAFPINTYGKNAGFGFNSRLALGCTVRAYNNIKSENFTYPLRHVEIKTDENNPLRDELHLMVGSANSFYANLKVTHSFETTSGPILVNSRFGVRTGDILLVAERGKDCTMMQVTDLPNNIGERHIIKVDGTTYTNENGLNKNAVFNTPGFSNIDYTSSAYIANFGRDPKKLTFFINDTGMLIQRENFDGVNKDTTLGYEAVAFKAVYGIDNDNNGTVDTWSNVSPPIEEIYKIVGIKYMLVSRSKTVQNSYDLSCSTTVNPIMKWTAGSIDLSELGDNWGCFRYRMVESTVPFKNMLWKE